MKHAYETPILDMVNLELIVTTNIITASQLTDGEDFGA